MTALKQDNGTSSMKSFFLILVLLAVLAATLWWAIYAWTSVDVEMSIHGYIAIILGVVFSLMIGCGLMALMFYSSRHGYDEPPDCRWAVITHRGYSVKNSKALLFCFALLSREHFATVLRYHSCFRELVGCPLVR